MGEGVADWNVFQIFFYAFVFCIGALLAVVIMIAVGWFYKTFGPTSQDWEQ